MAMKKNVKKEKAKNPKPTLATFDLKNAQGRGTVEKATAKKTASKKTDTKKPIKAKKPTKKETTKVLVVRVPLDRVEKLEAIRTEEKMTMDGLLNQVVGNYLRNKK
jgi:hypothetical protein